ncbi:MAG: STAS domain-containing protein [Solirubrobacteraceae bacterium]
MPLFRRHVIEGDLTIRSVREGDTHVVEPVGALDRRTAEQLEDELLHVEATDASEILVDLESLHFIDSAGIKVFLLATDRSLLRPGRLMILPGPKAVQRAFEISGLESRLPFVVRKDA